MRTVHFPSDGFIIAGRQGHTCIQQTVYLINGIFGPNIILLRNDTDNLFEPFGLGIAQKLHFGMFALDGFDGAFATFATFVVGGAYEFVFYTRVDKHHLVSVCLRVERHILKFAGFAVQTHQMSRFAVNGGKLVHNAALHSYVVVFGRLSHFGEGHFVESEVEQVIQRKSIGGFESCGARHTGSQRHVTAENRIEGLNRSAPFDKFAADAEEVFGPLFFGGILFVEAEFGAFAEVEGIGSYFVGSVEFDFGHHAFVDGSGEYEPAVIVGVFSDEVYSSGRGVYGAFGAVEFFEFISNFGNVHSDEALYGTIYSAIRSCLRIRLPSKA